VGEVTATRVVLLSEVNSKFGAPVLAELLRCRDVEVAGLVTSPPGRLCDYYIDEPDPVDLAAQATVTGVPVLRPQRVNDPACVEQIARLRPDYLLIANYQQILRQELLDVPRVGTVNFHPSPLPRYAGLAPFFWMAKHGEHDGGVSAVLTTTEIDGGPLLAQRPVPMTGTETAGEIRDLHFRASWQLLRELLPDLVAERLSPCPQDASARTYFGHPRDEDYTIDWEQDVETVLRTIRASLPHPGAVAVTASGQVFRILGAEPGGAAAPGYAGPGAVDLAPGARPRVRAADGWVTLTDTGGSTHRYDRPVAVVGTLTTHPAVVRTS
jgi:methionyl-tRNA formyltransferase